MCRQTITSGQTKDDLSHLGRITILMAPARLQRLDHAAHGRFIVWEQIRSVSVRTSAPVRAHSGGLESTDLDTKRGHFFRERLSESSNSPLGSVVRRWRKVAVACVIDHYIETAKRIYCHLHCRIGGRLIGNVEGSGANLIAILLYQIFQATRIAGCCDEAIARCEHCFSNVAAQTASAASNQPHLRHQNP